MTRALVLTVAQGLGVATALVGLDLLAGTAWTALVGGVGLCVFATLVELAGRPAPRPPVVPRLRDGD